MDTHSKNAFEIFKILNSHEIVKDINTSLTRKIQIMNYGKNIIKSIMV